MFYRTPILPILLARDCVIVSALSRIELVEVCRMDAVILSVPVFCFASIVCARTCSEIPPRFSRSVLLLMVLMMRSDARFVNYFCFCQILQKQNYYQRIETLVVPETQKYHFIVSVFVTFHEMPIL